MSHPNIVRHDTEKYYYDPKTESQKGNFPFNDSSERSVDLSIIVPAYNEELRLPVMLDETIEFLEKRSASLKSYSYEIIVIDDGSKDKTTEVAQEYTKKYGANKVRVLTLFRNKGKGGAVRMGILSSRGKYLLMADADAATRFSDIVKLEAKIKEIEKDSINGMAIAVGSRAHLEEDSIANRSLFRTILMKGFHLLVWFLCVRTVRDTQCGFKLFNRKAAFTTFLNLHVERWAFDAELLYIAESLNIPIAEVAVYWTEIDGSKMVPVLSWIQMGWDLLLIYIWHMTRMWTIEKME
uniref:dolichyl-phosphate beta-glucosyltransferase-like n=1 Tax=Styela clava TaxID=7725 RepID=UPI00193960C4|nr:dolichyl-phosphate beta-glucosyltransferase-like [Styela clava]